MSRFEGLVNDTKFQALYDGRLSHQLFIDRDLMWTVLNCILDHWRNKYLSNVFLCTNVFRTYNEWWSINDLNTRDPVFSYAILFIFCFWIDLQDHTMNLAVIRFLFFAQKFRFCNIENLFWKFWSINLLTRPYYWWFVIMSSLSCRGSQIKSICVQVQISNCKECFSTHFLEMMKSVTLLSTDQIL